MHMRSVFYAAVAASALTLGLPAAVAQQTTQGTGSDGQQQQQQQQNNRAEQCLNDLQALNERMQEDGFWITGWGSRWGYGTGPGTAQSMDGDAGTGGAAGTGAAPTAPGAGPWGTQRWGITSPRYQIQALQQATSVLGNRGNQEGCQAVLAELRQVYDGYVSELEEAGIDPREVTDWRQAQIASAKPVEELSASFVNVDNITGTEVRNAEDEQLGTIDDVILDPESGGVRYVVLSVGGVLGIGSDYVAVPWKALKATPGLNTFVLNVSEQVIEEAPQVDPDRFADPQTAAQKRDRVDQYWNEKMSG